MDRAVTIAANLTSTLRELQKAPPEIIGRHGEALQKLTEIFAQATTQLEERHERNIPTSTNPTAPKELKKAPRVHQRQTRQNTPGQLPLPSAISEGVNNQTQKTASQQEQPISEGVRQTTPPSPEVSLPTPRRSTRSTTQPEVIPTNRQQRAARRQMQGKIQDSEAMIYTIPTPKVTGQSSRPKTMHTITQEALQAIALSTIQSAPSNHFPFTHCNQRSESRPDEEYHHSPGMEHFCAPVIHPTSGEIIS